MEGHGEARLNANANIVQNRTALVRAEVKKLLTCLDEADLWHLRRAEMGLPLVVLEWNQHPDGSGNASLVAIEAITEKLLGRYQAEPPETYYWPDLRADLRQLQVSISDLREALSAGQVDNAIGRAVAVGAGIGRVGYWLLAGGDAASGATRGFAGSKGGNTTKAARENADRASITSAGVKSVRAGQSSQSAAEFLHRQAAKHSEQHWHLQLRQPAEHREPRKKVPAVRTIRGWIDAALKKVGG